MAKAWNAEERAREAFGRIEEIAAHNQRKVILAMQRAKVSETHFAGTTGYGYGDRGRETLDEVYALAFGAQSALVRHQITTGTQALGICMFGNLRPGDELLSATGKPYDTLEELIGIRGGGGTPDVGGAGIGGKAGDSGTANAGGGENAAGNDGRSGVDSGAGGGVGSSGGSDDGNDGNGGAGGSVGGDACSGNSADVSADGGNGSDGSGVGSSGGGPGSLMDFGITYREVPLLPSGRIDLNELRSAISARTKMVLIQRSRGYGWRDALQIDEIAQAVSLVRSVKADAIILVDNCYGEFVDRVEPIEAGADLIAGSLIKNPGGGLAPCGGYVAGRADYVRNASYRLTMPGLGGDVGPTLGQGRLLFQGFFMAPHVVAESLKGAIFCAALMEAEGYSVSPGVDARRSDIIQAVRLGSAERLEAFCQGIQMGSAVDSFVEPRPWLMPGYEHPVIMAAGAFVQGSSIELSADGPMIPP
ncbi:MAG: methionine gamma-lyase family protein, partial [Clostridiales bacterium]|nr:methionine gamma-lyase family protein [Clostridiales bacterium]